MRTLSVPWVTAGLMMASLGGCVMTQPSGELRLSNFSNGRVARVQAVVTASPDCTSRGDGFVSAAEFMLPLNGTRLLEAPNGADICWRHQQQESEPDASHWSEWSRAVLSPGRTVSSTL